MVRIAKTKDIPVTLIDIYCVNTGQVAQYPLGITLEEIRQQLGIQLKSPVCGAIVNHKVKELSFAIVKSKKVEFIDYSHPDGRRLYTRSWLFLLYVAVRHAFPNLKLHIPNGISNGYFCELTGADQSPAGETVARIKSEMKKLIQQNIPFEKKGLPTGEAVHLLNEQGLPEKARLLDQQGLLFSYVYFLGDSVNYFYGHHVPSTGYLKTFDLCRYFDGMLLQVPRPDCFNELNEVLYQRKLYGEFQEHKHRAEILEVPDLGSLNGFIQKGRGGEIIKISEALQEKKIVAIADRIDALRDQLRVVLIAGPSASGKTTFSKRLSVQLAVNGIRPHLISLDDYFVDREKTPRDAEGNYDFEALEAIDIDFLNEQLTDLFAGKEIELPKFNFFTGKREPSGRFLRMGKNDLLMLEGIHGMNPNLIPQVPEKISFKIFLSALTQISLDDHNHISTTDNRLVRRMIRDSKYRGYSADETIRRWPSVRVGEERNIFPFQENADIMFNSSLIYELAVLKKYVEPLLKEVPEMKAEYCEATRLLKFFSYFKHLDDQEIPPTSLLREFLGGSSFRY